MGENHSKETSAYSSYWMAILVIVLALTYQAYTLGFTAGWTFDDTRFLQHLTHVHDLDSAIEFLIRDKGISPTDRPIAMATFLLNTNDWPDNPSGFREINAYIHIANGFLVFLVIWMIARTLPLLKSTAVGFSVTVAAIWLLHPLFASTSLHIIQRMALLAATFSLLGFSLYIYGRGKLIAGNRVGYSWMTLGIFISAGIGTLAKENAALTPLLIAVTEFTLLQHYAPITENKFRNWKIVFLGFPAIALFLYSLYFLVIESTQAYLIRPFTLEERLLSESVVMFEYIRQLFIPDITVMGPFQDDSWRIRQSSIFTWGVMAIWIIIASTALLFHKKAPGLSFAILFFLTGHLLESTFFSLELYFEHRNYIPSLGLLAAVIAFAWTREKTWPKYITGLAVILMAILLSTTTSLWGDKKKSALEWAKKHPTSTRATQNLSTYYQQAGEINLAAETIIRAYKAAPLDASLAMNAIIFSCFDTTTTDQNKEIFTHILKNVTKLSFSTSAIITLHRKITLHAQKKCKTFNADHIVAIAEGLLNNPSYQRPVQKYGLLMAAARARETQNRITEAIDLKIQAYRTTHAIQAAHTIFFQLTKLNRIHDAQQFLSEAKQLSPKDSAQFKTWESTIQHK